MPAINTSKKPQLLAIVLLLCALPGLAQAADRPSTEEAKTFMRELVMRASAALSGEGDIASRESAFRALLADGFHMPLIARVAMGRFWKQSSKAEQATFTQLFSEFILKTYGARLGGFDAARFHVVDVIERGNTDRLVRTQIEQDSGPAVKAGWRIRKFGAKLKIIDVSVEGISMTLNQRREFQTVMQRDGITGLLELLRARVEPLPLDRPKQNG